MNEKTCKRMRRYIKSIGFNPSESTLYQWQGDTTPITLPYKRMSPQTLTVPPQTFRGQYQKLKKMVKQNRLYAPIHGKKPTWVSAKPDKLTEITDTGTYLIEGGSPGQQLVVTVKSADDTV